MDIKLEKLHHEENGDMKQYIGITLGPIGDTMNLTSSPAGLWAASYLFSKLAHDIREKIEKSGLIQDDLEYETGKTVSLIFYRGVGLYHDRVIYQADEEHTLEQASTAVRDAVNSIIDGFSKAKKDQETEDELKKYFDAYFNIHIVCVEVSPEENFLFKVNDALDAAELEKNFPSTISFNPILELFDGNEKGKNEAIKNSFLIPREEGSKDINQQWILFNKSGKGIKDLPGIAMNAGIVHREEAGKNKDQPKASVYYAVIQADGDNMGQTLKNTIRDEDSYTEFSKKCFIYGCKTAEIVLKYGGIPIYVGGDDLLCIAPLMCRHADGEHTFLEMISEIRSVFKKEFTEGPDLSFGVQIQYVKTPLYEALGEAGRLLFCKAKENKPGALAVNLRKHSGQSAEFLIRGLGNDEGGEKVRTVLDFLIRKHASEETLKSVGKHVADYSELLNQAVKEGTDSVNNYFNNVFDNGVSDDDRQYLDKIKELTILLYQKQQTKCNDGTIEISDLLGSYIRFIKFFSETVDGEERTL